MAKATRRHGDTGTRRDTLKAERSMRRIESLTGLLLTEVLALRSHYNNRIAAHKAHHTMKKRKLNAKGGTT